MRRDDLLAQAPGISEIAAARVQAGPGSDLDPWVGKAYKALHDLNPGDEFWFSLGTTQFRLVSAGSADEEP